jgi:uncharacterized protein YukE
MKFLSVFALLALTCPTVVLSEDGEVAAAAAAAPECDCSPEIQAHMTELVAQRDALSSSLGTVQSEHESIAAKVKDCATTLKTPKKSLIGEAAVQEFQNQVTQFDEQLTAEFDEKKELLREMSVAIKIFKEREEESRKELTALFEEYKERKDEFNMYILEHQQKTETLYQEIIMEMSKPGPLVNFVKIWEDAKTLVRSLGNLKKDKVKEEPVQEDSSPEGGEDVVG